MTISHFEELNRREEQRWLKEAQKFALPNPLPLVAKHGGLRPDLTVVAELTHASGGRRYVFPGLIRRSGRGQTMAEAAAMLEDSGFPVWGSNGNADDGIALQLLVDTIRSRNLRR